MRKRDFQQVDVFSDEPLKGNPVAVVLGADGMSTQAMQDFTRWMNLSESTFLLKPTDPAADYRVRIFTPAEELPFAGHPTLGSCHAWLRAGGQPKGDCVVQECTAGMVQIRRTDEALAFAAPPLVRDGPVSEADLAKIAAGLGVPLDDIVRSQWIDNGPGWVGAMLRSREALLAVRPNYDAMGDLEIGVVAPCEAGDETQFEVRAFMPSFRAEDPVTGSLNASIAQWLIGAGVAPPHYVAAQGTMMNRVGRIHVSKDGETIWIGGKTTTWVDGQVSL